jgi:hypothetical protein
MEEHRVMGREDFVTINNGKHRAFEVQRRLSGEEAEAERQQVGVHDAIMIVHEYEEWCAESATQGRI